VLRKSSRFVRMTSDTRLTDWQAYDASSRLLRASERLERAAREDSFYSLTLEDVRKRMRHLPAPHRRAYVALVLDFLFKV